MDLVLNPKVKLHLSFDNTWNSWMTSDEGIETVVRNDEILSAGNGSNTTVNVSNTP